MMDAHGKPYAIAVRYGDYVGLTFGRGVGIVIRRFVLGALEKREGRHVGDKFPLEGTERVSNGAVSFDTQRVVDRLREGGWDEGQARALCDVLREIMRGVATKVEIAAVKTEIQELKISTKADIRRLEEKMDVQFQALRTETKAENQALRTEFQAMQEQMKGLRQLMVIGFSVMATMMATLMAVVAVSASLLLGAAP